MQKSVGAHVVPSCQQAGNHNSCALLYTPHTGGNRTKKKRIIATLFYLFFVIMNLMGVFEAWPLGVVLLRQIVSRCSKSCVAKIYYNFQAPFRDAQRKIRRFLYKQTGIRREETKIKFLLLHNLQEK